MTIYGRFHDKWVHGRRVRVIADALAELLPSEGSVLDVGSGDGFIDKLIMQRRPGV